MNIWILAGITLIQGGWSSVQVKIVNPEVFTTYENCDETLHFNQEKDVNLSLKCYKRWVKID